MEQIKELEEVLELLNTKQYTKLRQYLAELNDADIAGLLEELEEEDMLKVFRILLSSTLTIWANNRRDRGFAIASVTMAGDRNS